jgi:hypothetical protein
MSLNETLNICVPVTAQEMTDRGVTIEEGRDGNRALDDAVGQFIRIELAGDRHLKPYRKSEAMFNDVEGLLKPEPGSEPETNTALSIFLALQVAQLIWCLFFGPFIPPPLIAFGLLAIASLNVFVCQSQLGRVLVGLSWKVTFAGPPYFTHEIEPDPFVPKKLNANCFWIGLTASVIIALTITVGLLFAISRAGFLTVALAALATAVYAVSLSVFFSIQKIASKATAEAVKIVLLGQNVAFPDAEEVSESGDAAKTAVPAVSIAKQTTTEEEEEEEEIV